MLRQQQQQPQPQPQQQQQQQQQQKYPKKLPAHLIIQDVFIGWHEGFGLFEMDFYGMFGHQRTNFAHLQVVWISGAHWIFITSELGGV